MPGYTHLQIAMPSSFGLWFGAYAETLVDDMRLLAAAWHIANQNPLGSAAGYGSSFPLDRTMTTRLLGFEDAALQRRGGADEPRQERTRRSGRHRRRSRDDRPAGDGRLPVHEPELRLRVAARRADHRVEHHAPQEESRRLRDHARTLQPPAIGAQRNRAADDQPPGGLPPRPATAEGHPLPGDDRDQTDALGCATSCSRTCASTQHILDDPKYDYLFTVEDVNRLVLAGHALPRSLQAGGHGRTKGRSTRPRARCATPTKAASAISAPPKSAGKWSA